MFEFLSDSWVRDLAINLAVSLIVFAVGFLIGKHRERRMARGRNLEQYDFYPFSVDPQGFPEFNLGLFERAVEHLLDKPDATAAGQLVVIGEQNGVRYQLGPEALDRYEKFYARNHGLRVMQDNSEFLETTGASCAFSAQRFATWGSRYCFTTWSTRRDPSSASLAAR